MVFCFNKGGASPVEKTTNLDLENNIQKIQELSQLNLKLEESLKVAQKVNETNIANISS